MDSNSEQVDPREASRHRQKSFNVNAVATQQYGTQVATGCATHYRVGIY